MRRIDVHQHLWTERLCDALAARSAAPLLRSDHDGWVLELDGEEPFALAGAPEDAGDRVTLLDDLGLDAAVVALSTALGVEALPADEARQIIAAWDEDCDALPDRLPAWGSVPLSDADPRDVDDALDRGRVGVTLPASALSSPDALDRIAPLLERVALRDAPLFVHPGPSAAGTWLPPLTAYVASLSEAWHAWALHGRAQHPTLRIVFAALAGLAPLHAERLAARASGADVAGAVADPLTFYDTSSYGPVATAAMAGVVGEQSLVNGSDWPYAAPTTLSPLLAPAVVEHNPATLLGRRPAATVAS